MKLEAAQTAFLAIPRIRQRAGHRLTQAAVKQARQPGKFADGNGLWLIVEAANRRYWQYRYQQQGRTKSLSFGSVDRVSLAEARARHAEARLMVERGIDPQARRRAAIEMLTPPTAPAAPASFAFAATEYLAAHEAGWKHPKHRQQWQNTLASTYPLIGDVAVGAIDTADVLRVLNPIWQATPETASRLRGRIAAVIDYATVRGWRERGPNPAAWHGHLEHALAPKGKLRPAAPHPALDWREAPAFMTALRDEAGMSALALEFLILTAARSGEVRGARWDEIDLTTGIWTVPAERMKAGRAHRVPLSRPALMILLKLAEVRDGSGLIFFGRARGQPLSDMSLTALLRRMGCEATVHGFRSTFRDWVADSGGPADAAERALAHTIGNKVRAAYERSDLLDVRRRLMADWASYLAKPEADVVALRAA